MTGKRPRRRRTWQLTCTIYPFGYWLHHCTIEQITAWLLARGTQPIDLDSQKIGASWALVDENTGERDFIIWLSQDVKPKQIDGLQVIVHEAMHTTFDVMTAVGLPCVPETHEAFCYFHDWLVGACLERLIR